MCDKVLNIKEVYMVKNDQNKEQKWGFFKKKLKQKMSLKL